MTPTEAAFLLWHHSLASAAKRAEIEGLGAVQIIVGREGSSALEARIFGSVAGTLVQTAPVPCTIVP